MRRVPKALLATSLAFASAAALAHGNASHERKAARPMSSEEKPFGREGDAKRVSRSVNVVMSDQMRFTPDALTVRQGETIRFRVKNAGNTMHEMVLGTMADLKEHAE